MVWHQLNRSLTVWRVAAGPDGMGGQTSAWAQIGTVRSRVAQASTSPGGAERMRAAQGEARHTHSVYLHPGAAVRRGDQLRGDDQVFEVIATVSPSAPGVYLRADCELHQPEEVIS